MTKKQENFHKSLVRSIHLSRKYKEFYRDNKEEYVELLQEHFGVTSSKELSIDQLISFVDFMNFKRHSLPKYESRADEPCTHAQLSTMRGLWSDFARTKTDEKLLAFVNRNRRTEYAEMRLVSKIDAQKIIPILKTMKANSHIKQFENHMPKKIGEFLQGASQGKIDADLLAEDIAFARSIAKVIEH